MFSRKKLNSEWWIGKNGGMFEKVNRGSMLEDRELDKIKLSLDAKIALILWTWIAAFIALWTAVKAQEIIDGVCYTEVAWENIPSTECVEVWEWFFQAEPLGTVPVDSTIIQPSERLIRFQWFLEDSWYEVSDFDGFSNFISIFGDTLEYLETYVLTWEDINAAMNLYSAWIQKDIFPDQYIAEYEYFLQSYPNPEIDLVSRLRLLWIEFFDWKKV